MASVRYKDYIIDVWVDLYNPYTDITECEFETISDAREYKRRYSHFKRYKTRYAAAEQINSYGDRNPSVKGRTKKEAINKLIRILDEP